jgi:GxxExxY protein
MVAERRDFADREQVDQITQAVIGCAFRVANTLGHGFLEKVYENALAHEIRKSGLKVDQQHGIRVHYDSVVVGEYVPDLLVEEQVIVELKAVQALDDMSRAQCLNYLKATGYGTCLLLNFGRPHIEVKRIVVG